VQKASQREASSSRELSRIHKFQKLWQSQPKISNTPMNIYVLLLFSNLSHYLDIKLRCTLVASTKSCTSSAGEDCMCYQRFLKCRKQLSSILLVLTNYIAFSALSQIQYIAVSSSSPSTYSTYIKIFL
jgi:hypothetical protein